MKKIRFFSAVVMILLLVMNYAVSVAETAGVSVYAGPGFTADGLTCVLDGKVYFCDYATGSCVPLCTRSGCDHSVPDIDYLLSHFGNSWEIMEDDTVCYAARLRKGTTVIPIILDHKIYYARVEPDYDNESQDLTIWESEVDGPSRLIARLDQWFPGCDSLMINEMMISNGALFISTHLFPEDSDINEATEKEILIKVSLATGEASLLYEINAQYCETRLMNCVDNILYFVVAEANGFTPLDPEIAENGTDEQLKAYYREFDSKLLHSIMGIRTDNGEQVILDDRLIHMKREYAWDFEVCKDRYLYASLIPQTPDEKTAVLMKFDLTERKLISELPYTYYEDTTYYPYCVLTDDTVLDFSMELGRFAVHNLKSGEVKVLDIRGDSIYGANTDVYTIYSYLWQQDPLLLYHYYPDGTEKMAYIYTDDLLKGNAAVRDFE